MDGRKESDAPYWLAGCNDGLGERYYNFAGRGPDSEIEYFAKALASFSTIRTLMKKGGTLVQMLAYSDPARQLRLYLQMLEAAGCSELREKGQHRIWRDVPGRSWHANSKGRLACSREVVLIHKAN